MNGRRSIYVTKDIKKGDKFSNENIKSIRPTFGLHPKYLEFFLNKKSNQNIKLGSRLQWKHLVKN